MNRLAVILPLLLAIISSSCEPTRQPDPVGVKRSDPDASKRPDPVEVKRADPVASKKPERPPEFFGVIEKVERRSIGNSADFDAVLLKGHPPLAGFPKPSFPPGAIGYRDRLWLNLPNTTVEQRSGPLAVGQYVWVWHGTNKFFKTEPEQIYPEYVLTETVSPK